MVIGLLAFAVFASGISDGGAQAVSVMQESGEGKVDGLGWGLPDTSQIVAPSRVLLNPELSGAIKVRGVPYPDQTLEGVYYPTSRMVNGGTAYRKDGHDPKHASHLWLAKDPHGYWCIQPTNKLNTADALMITVHQHLVNPQAAQGWQLWRGGGWRVQHAVQVLSCRDHPCEADAGPPSASVPEARPVPTPDPLEPAFDNSPGVSLLTPIYLVENPNDTTTFKMWAGLAVLAIAMMAFTCCLLHSENKAGRSYVYAVKSSTLALMIGILFSSQVVPFFSGGFWRTSWVIELVLFVFGFFMLHWICWKCQFAPVRRTIVWTFGGYLVGAMGACAFLDLREAFFGWDYEDGAELALCMLLATCMCLVVLDWLAKRLDSKQFAEPSAKSWPAKPPPEMFAPKDRGGCMDTRSCMNWNTKAADQEDVMDPLVEENFWHEWTLDACRATYIAASIIAAFALYNWLRVCAMSFASPDKLWLAWLIIVLVIVALMACVTVAMRRKKKDNGDADYHADMLIVGTLSRVLGLCVVGEMRKVNPGLREQLQDWFGVSSFTGALIEVIGLTFLVLLAITLLSCRKQDKEEDEEVQREYGGLEFINGYPEEVVGFAMALGIAWTVIFSGMLGDLVRFSSFLSWDGDAHFQVWMHAFFCLIAAGLLYLFWRRVVLRKMMMSLEDHTEMVEKENEIYAKIEGLREKYESPGI